MKNMKAKNATKMVCPNCGSENYEWMADVPWAEDGKPYCCHNCDTWFGEEETEEDRTAESTLNKITELRSRAFDMANSGKYGEYPYDDTFNDAVEEGFSDDGTQWTALDGTTISI